MTVPADPFDAPDFDPNAFLDRLIFTDPDADFPIPPQLTAQDQIVVRRTYEIPVADDVLLRRLAVARGLTVPQLLSELAHRAA